MRVGSLLDMLGWGHKDLLLKYMPHLVTCLLLKLPGRLCVRKESEHLVAPVVTLPLKVVRASGSEMQTKAHGV